MMKLKIDRKLPKLEKMYEYGRKTAYLSYY